MSVWMPTTMVIVPVVVPRVVAPKALHGPWPPELFPLMVNVTTAEPGVIAPLASVPLSSCQLPVMPRDAPDPPAPDPPGPEPPPVPVTPAHPARETATSAEQSSVAIRFRIL